MATGESKQERNKALVLEAFDTRAGPAGTLLEFLRPGPWEEWSDVIAFGKAATPVAVSLPLGWVDDAGGQGKTGST